MHNCPETVREAWCRACCQRLAHALQIQMRVFRKQPFTSVPALLLIHQLSREQRLPR